MPLREPYPEQEDEVPADPGRRYLLGMAALGGTALVILIVVVLVVVANRPTPGFARRVALPGEPGWSFKELSRELASPDRPYTEKESELVRLIATHRWWGGRMTEKRLKEILRIVESTKTDWGWLLTQHGQLIPLNRGGWEGDDYERIDQIRYSIPEEAIRLRALGDRDRQEPGFRQEMLGTIMADIFEK